MRKFVAGVLGVAVLFGVAACGDSKEESSAKAKTESATPPAQEQAAPGSAAVDNNTEVIAPRPSSGTGGEMPTNGQEPAAVAPKSP